MISASMIGSIGSQHPTALDGASAARDNTGAHSRSMMVLISSLP